MCATQNGIVAKKNFTRRLQNMVEAPEMNFYFEMHVYNVEWYLCATAAYKYKTRLQPHIECGNWKKTTYNAQKFYICKSINIQRYDNYALITRFEYFPKDLARACARSRTMCILLFFFGCSHAYFAVEWWLFSFIGGSAKHVLCALRFVSVFQPFASERAHIHIFWFEVNFVGGEMQQKFYIKLHSFFCATCLFCLKTCCNNRLWSEW